MYEGEDVVAKLPVMSFGKFEFFLAREIVSTCTIDRLSPFERLMLIFGDSCWGLGIRRKSLLIGRSEKDREDAIGSPKTMKRKENRKKTTN